MDYTIRKLTLFNYYIYIPKIEKMDKLENHLKRVFVSNLSKELTEQDLLNVFGQAGRVVHILLFKNNREDTNVWASEGECVLMYETEESARAAISMFDETHMLGLKLTVHIDDCAMPKDMFRFMSSSSRTLDENANVSEA
jgi:RNA recognition motif-containing protein